MALGDNYAKLEELKARVSIDDGVDDPPMQEALNSASRHVEEFCRRQFNKADTPSPTARVFEPLSNWRTQVDDFYTTTGLVVKTDEDDDGVFEKTWTSPTDYELRPLNGVHNGLAGFPYWSVRAVGTLCFPRSRRATVQVTADWGWSAVPAPVKEATLILAEEIWKMKDAPFGVAGFGDFGSIRVRDNPKVQSLLSDYRRRAVRLR